jgi:hypothetical protein
MLHARIACIHAHDRTRAFTRARAPLLDATVPPAACACPLPRLPAAHRLAACATNGACTRSRLQVGGVDEGVRSRVVSPFTIILLYKKEVTGAGGRDPPRRRGGGGAGALLGPHTWRGLPPSAAPPPLPPLSCRSRRPRCGAWRRAWWRGCHGWAACSQPAPPRPHVPRPPARHPLPVRSRRPPPGAARALCGPACPTVGRPAAPAARAGEGRRGAAQALSQSFALGHLQTGRRQADRQADRQAYTGVAYTGLAT